MLSNVWHLHLCYRGHRTRAKGLFSSSRQHVN